MLTTLFGIFLLFSHLDSILARLRGLGENSASSTQAHDFSPYYRNHCKSHPDKCAFIELSVSSISTNNLIHALESNEFRTQETDLLSNHYMYYVSITLQNPPLQNDTLRTQYEELDKFITERPWWKVQQYPVIYQQQSKALPLLLEHLPKYLTDVGKAIVAVHFPPKEECLKRKLYVRAGMSSWGIDLQNIDSYYMRYPDYIHGIFTSNRGKNVIYEGHVEKTKGGCADKFNLHNCVFLESTNCTYPESFLKFCNPDKGENCPKNGVYDAKNRTFLGEFEPQDAPGVHIPLEKIFPPIPDDLFKPYTSAAYKTFDSYVVTPATVKYEPKHTTVNHINVYQGLWRFGVAYKYNYHLGIRIQEYLQYFYSMYHKPEKGESFTVHDNCVAAHIRKGDRNLPGVDMIQYCRDHMRIKDGKLEIIGNWINGQPMSYGNFADLGCGYAMPFGALNLQHIVNSSLILEDETLYSSSHRLNILVMTDEIPTLEQELEEFKKVGYGRDKVRVIVFPSRLASVHKSRLSWEATVEWWAGIEAMKRCSAYMMHTASAASSAIFLAMCYSHGDGYMKCPPTVYFQ